MMGLGAWMLVAVASAALVGDAPAGAASEEKSPRPPRYQPVGAPADPKVAVAWNRYHDHDEMSQILKDLAAAHPGYAKLESVGKSYGDRDLWVLTVTDFSEGDDRLRPAFWIDAGIHANEIQATEIALYTAWYLLEAREIHPEVARMLRERVFYIAPSISPDSRDAHFYEPNSTHSPRSGQRPKDDDRDGLIDEDKPNDLDGDGHITQMRVRNPNGRYKSHPDFPQLMIPAEPDEKGEFDLLGPEGIDNDEDGLVNEDSDGYYDPNRDWGWNWQPGYVQRGAHRYPFSILENRYIADFILAHRNIAGAQSYHNSGGMLLRGPGTLAEAYNPADIAVYDALAAKGELALPGYRYLITSKDLYEVWGGEVDWFHFSLGVFTFTNELFTPFNLFRKPSESGFFGRQEDFHRFSKYLLQGDGFVEWHEVDHPTYGRIEVGGFKKNWLRQPPSFLLEEECHRNMAFTLYHADQMPLVRIADVQAKRLNGAPNQEGGLVEITARITNERMIPTHSAADIKNKVTPPNRVSLKSDRPLQVHAGLVSETPFFVSPREQKANPANLRVRNVPGMRAVHVRWLVTGDGPFVIESQSLKGGSHRTTVTLP